MRKCCRRNMRVSWYLSILGGSRIEMGLCDGFLLKTVMNSFVTSLFWAAGKMVN